MSMAAQDGQGWRADCLGDMGGFSKTWNHMEHYYLQQLDRTAAQEAWKTGPVAFESCWDMRKWKQENWDIASIFDYALRCHASYMNNKSAPIPEEARPEIERFLRRLGYRLTLERLEHRAQVEAGEGLNLRILWNNVGVAPPYRDYRVAVRLTPLRERAEPEVLVSDTTIRGWLPGRHETALTVPVVQTLPAGKYQLALGLVDPTSQKPAVQLAIDGRDREGWYPLSQFEIRR